MRIAGWLQRRANCNRILALQELLLADFGDVLILELRSHLQGEKAFPSAAGRGKAGLNPDEQMHNNWLLVGESFSR